MPSADNKLIPWSRILSLKNLRVAKLIKKLPSFYVMTNFVTIFVTCRWWTLFRAA